MRFLRRIAGFLGIANHDSPQEEAREGEENDDVLGEDVSRVEETTSHLPRKGFSVPVQVAVDRAQVGPIIVPCTVGDGGVQGLRWYARRLRIDEDGDVADEFVDEVLPEMASNVEVHQRPVSRFELKYSTKPAKVRNQALSRDGKIQQFVEYQGKLQLV